MKNQASCGSCWAFATTAVVEFGKCINTGIPGSIRYILVRPNIPSVYNIQIRFAFDSEQQLVDCSSTNGCGGGWYGSAWSYLANNGGQDTSASYPYTAKNGVCKASTSVVGATLSKTAAVVSIKANDTNTMITLLQNKRLVAVAIAVVNSFFGYR